MKSHQIIADALSEWRSVASAADLAHETFDQLDDDELRRLATRGYTEEVRAALRRKVKGVPVYSNVERIAPDGSKETIYKQTALFEVDDFEKAIRSYAQRATDNLSVAQALAIACRERLGVVIPLPFGDEAAS